MPLGEWEGRRRQAAPSLGSLLAWHSLLQWSELPHLKQLPPLPPLLPLAPLPCGFHHVLFPPLPLVGWYHCEEVGIGLWITGGRPTGAATLGVSTGTAGFGLDFLWRLC